LLLRLPQSGKPWKYLSCPVRNTIAALSQTFFVLPPFCHNTWLLVFLSVFIQNHPLKPGLGGSQPVILAAWELRLEGSRFQGNSSRDPHTHTPISKITRAKWTGDMVHAVESLLYKHEALSSNPSPTPPPKKLLLDTRGVAQVIEYLPSKHKALSTNPSTARKKYFLKARSGGIYL
jgi:hypothetical protein